MLPFLEALIGISLILGLLTKWALLAGSLLMSMLSFGTCCARIGQTVGVQMILSVFLYSYVRVDKSTSSTNTYTHSNRRIFSSAQRFQLFAACFALYYLRDADVLWTIKKRQ